MYRQVHIVTLNCSVISLILILRTFLNENIYRFTETGKKELKVLTMR
jgi:hypothetical protein